MFWEKRKFNDLELGEMMFEGGYWSSNIQLEDNQLLIDIEGSKLEPNAEALLQAKSLLKGIDDLVEQSVKFIEQQGISQFSDDLESIVLDGFTSYEEVGKYDVNFGLSDWVMPLLLCIFEKMNLIIYR